MTSQRQISLFTAEPSTCSAADSPASHTAQQVSEKERKTRAISGPKCLEQFERFNRATSWAKMFAGSLIGTGDWYSTKCKLTWKLKATKCSRFYFQLVPSMRRIEEIEYGLLPTPQAIDGNGKGRPMRPKPGRKDYTKAGNWRGDLKDFVIVGLLPTPKVGGKEGYATRAARQGHKKAISHLESFVEYAMLPTPQAMEGEKITGKENQDSLTKRARQQTGKTSQLNPRFVAEMMGFPPNWTELPFLNGETSLSKATEMP